MEKSNVNVTGLMKDHRYITSMRWETSVLPLFFCQLCLSVFTIFSPCMSQVNLVSEHIWCKDFLVRSFYLKNVQTQETRTLTQFHLLSWPANGIPSSTRPLLDFRRYWKPHGSLCHADQMSSNTSHTQSAVDPLEIEIIAVAKKFEKSIRPWFWVFQNAELHA